MKHGEVERDEHDEVRQKATLNIRFFSLCRTLPHPLDYIEMSIYRLKLIKHEKAATC